MREILKLEFSDALALDVVTAAALLMALIILLAGAVFDHKMQAIGYHDIQQAYQEQQVLDQAQSNGHEGD